MVMVDGCYSKLNLRRYTLLLWLNNIEQLKCKCYNKTKVDQLIY